MAPSGGGMAPCDVRLDEDVTEVLDYAPRDFRVICLTRLKYVCKACCGV